MTAAAIYGSIYTSAIPLRKHKNEVGEMKQTTELKNYTIGFDPENAHAAFAAGVLKEELDKRTGLDFTFAPAGAGVIELSISQTLAPAPEGYYYEAKDGCVAIAGYDRHSYNSDINPYKKAPFKYTNINTDVFLHTDSVHFLAAECLAGINHHTVAVVIFVNRENKLSYLLSDFAFAVNIKGRAETLCKFNSIRTFNCKMTF